MSANRQHAPFTVNEALVEVDAQPLSSSIYFAYHTTDASERSVREENNISWRVSRSPHPYNVIPRVGLDSPPRCQTEVDAPITDSRRSFS